MISYVIEGAISLIFLLALSFFSLSWPKRTSPSPALTPSERLCQSIEQGDIVTFTALLKSSPLHLNWMHPVPQRTILHLACSVHPFNCKILEHLLESHLCDINAADAAGDTPLMLAVQAQNIEAVEMLVSCPGIKPDVKDSNGFTAFWMACALDNEGLALTFQGQLTSNSLDLDRRLLELAKTGTHLRGLLEKAIPFNTRGDINLPKLRNVACGLKEPSASTLVQHDEIHGDVAVQTNPGLQVKTIPWKNASVVTFCDPHGQCNTLAVIATAFSLRYPRHFSESTFDPFIEPTQLEDQLIKYFQDRKSFRDPLPMERFPNSHPTLDSLRSQGIKVFCHQAQLSLLGKDEVGILISEPKSIIFCGEQGGEILQVFLDGETKWSRQSKKPQGVPVDIAFSKKCDYGIVLCYCRGAEKFALSFEKLLSGFQREKLTVSGLIAELFKALNAQSLGFFAAKDIENYSFPFPGVAICEDQNRHGDDIDSVWLCVRIPDDCLSLELLHNVTVPEMPLRNVRLNSQRPTLEALLSDTSPVFLSMVIANRPYLRSCQLASLGPVVVESLFSFFSKKGVSLASLFCRLKDSTFISDCREETKKHLDSLSWSDLQVLSSCHPILLLEHRNLKEGFIMWISFRPSIEVLDALVKLVRMRVEDLAQKAKAYESQGKAQLATKMTPLTEPQKAYDLEIMSLPNTSQEYAHVLGLVKMSPQEVCRIKKTNYKSRREAFAAAQKALNSTPVRAFHGTPLSQNGRSIAKDGPDFSRCGKTNGSALGAGFYCSEEPSTARGYTQNVGTVCVIQVIPGVALQGSGGGTPDALRQRGYHSIQSNHVRVLSKPDQVVVDYLVDLAGSQDSFDDVSIESAPLRITEEWFAWQFRESVRQAEVSQLQRKADLFNSFNVIFSALASGLDLLQGDDTDFMSAFSQLSRTWVASKAEWTEAFVLKAPIYGKKREILQVIEDASVQVSFIQAPTGSGKTICIPLWILDKLASENDFFQEKRVAVLVPRSEIAQQQASFVAKLRGWTLGREVGYAVSGETLWNMHCPEHFGLPGAEVNFRSPLVFMTYGYFSESLYYKQMRLTEWAAIVYDESHERQTAADTLFKKLVDLQNEPISPKVIFLSATMNEKVLREYYERISGKRSATLDFSKGVSCPFPVAVEYLPIVSKTTHAGTLKKRKAHDILFDAISPILVGHHSGTQVEKNVVIFVSSVKLAQNLASKLARDIPPSQARVLSLYASLSPDERFRVFSHTQQTSLPCIVVATSIAESGLTLQNVSLIIDTGKKNMRTFNPHLQVFEELEMWISRASAEQRRGRAGRLCPGKCVRLYTESDLREEMPDFDSPRIQHDDISSSILRHFLQQQNAFDPAEFKNSLPEPPSDEHIGATFHHLQQLGLEEGNWKPEDVNRVPLNIHWAISLLVASGRQGCPASVAKIACLSEYTSFEVADDMTWYAEHTNSDHEVLLNLYEEWEKKGYNGFIVPRSVESLLHWFPVVRQRVAALQMSLKKMNMTAVDSVSEAGRRSVAIRKSLFAGFRLFRGTLTADQSDIQASQGGYHAGLRLKIHDSSLRFQSIPGTTVVFTSASRKKDSLNIKVKGLLVIDPQWTQQATTSSFRKTVPNEISRHPIQLPATVSVSMFEVFIIPQVQSSFFNTAIKREPSGGNYFLTYPESLRQQVKSFLDECISDVSLVDVTVPEIARLRLPNLAGKLRELAVSLCPVLATVSLDITVTGSTVRCCKMLATPFTTYLSSLGTTPVSAPGRSVPVSMVSSPAPAIQNPRLAILENAFMASEAILSLADFGGPGRVLLSLSHFITHHTSLFVYGGFVRDYIIRGETHSEMDLDVGFDSQYGKAAGRSSGVSRAEADSEWARVLTWGKAFGISQTGAQARGSHVTAFYMKGPNQEKINVELVDVNHFRATYGAPDADVNSLRILPVPAPLGATSSLPYKGAELSLKFPAATAGHDILQRCGTIPEIVARILRKELRILNPITFNPERRKKFESRKWKVL